MAPLKQVNKQQVPVNVLNMGIKTRSHLTTMKKEVLPKRKAEESPLKRATVKRSALLDQENAKENNVEGVILKNTLSRKTSTVSTTKKPLATLNVKKPVPLAQQQNKKEAGKLSLNVPIPVKVTESKLPKPRLVQKIVISRKTETIKTISTTTSSTATTTGVVTRRASRNSELEKSESSLYVSALEDLNLDENKKHERSNKQLKKSKPPPGVDDYDQEQMEDLGSVAMYAMDIFNYLKSRESHFKIDDYITKQTSINKTMRALLVDWMVEIQENFELNHETLYLAVKMVDLYLCKVNIKKENLQLVGCASLFVASKYDERIPPLIEDFLYVCDNLYDAKDILSMEIKLLKNLDFQLGIPLSYRFLRRYARCAKIDMPLLTLARYILEYSLMDYSTITFSDSKMAAASLLLAILMKDNGKWTPTLEYYSGYKLEDIKDLVHLLNEVLHKKQKDNIKTVKTKYSHKIFFEVAKIPLLDNIEL